MDDRVLLSVEDNDADFYVIQMALKQANIAIQVCRAHDGEEAISFLKRSGRFHGAPRPHMILLNLQMPRIDGSGCWSICVGTRISAPSLR